MLALKTLLWLVVNFVALGALHCDNIGSKTSRIACLTLIITDKEFGAFRLLLNVNVSMMVVVHVS